MVPRLGDLEEQSGSAGPGGRAAEGKGRAGPSLVRGFRFVPGCHGLYHGKKGKQLR